MPVTELVKPTTASMSVIRALTDTASGLGKDYLGSTIDSLTENEALHILTSMVREGTAGKDAPQFIKAILEIRAQAGAAIGPPPPTTPEQTYERLRRLFSLISQVELDRAYTDHASARDQILPKAPETPETAPEAPALPPEAPGTNPSGVE